MNPVTYLFTLFPNKNLNVLDIGCVGGTLQRFQYSGLHALLKTHYSTVVGLDFDRKGVYMMKQKGNNVIFADAQNFSLDSRYDLIIASNIIEHLPNLDGFLKSLKKHLSKKGCVCIWTPNAYSFINVLGIIFKGKRTINEEHVHWHSLETLRTLFTLYGFTIIATKFFHVKPNGGIINRLSMLLARFVSFFRPAFSETVLIVAKSVK